MNFTISARKTTVKDQFKDRVDKKLKKLDRFFDDNAAAVVTVTNEGDRETVEVTIQSGGMVFRSEKTTNDRMDSLEAVVDTLFKQIVKNKKKLEKKLHSAAFDTIDTDQASKHDQTQDESYTVVKTKEFVIKPMDIDEAILQMNMVGHEFYMFRNVENDHINVVYRRKNGSYGLLVPEED